MDVSFSEEQKLIMREARKLLAKKMPPNKVREVMKTEKGYSVELWSETAELGWLGLMVPQEYGGLWASFSDQLVLLGEMGRACTPGPHFSNLSGTIAVMEGGSHKQKIEILPQVIKGKKILTIAFDEFHASGRIVFYR